MRRLNTDECWLIACALREKARQDHELFAHGLEMIFDARRCAGLLRQSTQALALAEMFEAADGANLEFNDE